MICSKSDARTMALKRTDKRLPKTMSRRVFLAALLILPAAASSAAAEQEKTRGLLLHDGWVLRLDDLVRLARA